MRTSHIGITLGLLLGVARANAQVNLDFEAGDTSGWSVSGGQASVVTELNGQSAPDGNYFLDITAGCQTTTVSQTIPMTAGAKLQGWGAFQAQDYLPFNDWASAAIEVYGGASQLLFYSDVAQVGNYGSLPWTEFEFTAPEAGAYTIVFSSVNGGDCGLSSIGLFDLKSVPPDADGDGVLDAQDACITAPGEIVNASGCSIADLCPCGSAWKDHGAYVSCVAAVATDFRRARLIDEAQRATTVAHAAASRCGHQP